ncbi:hypothetical protein HPP92_019700 [Vanilla planifolia]|uniref:Sulfhydryl oxidase n=1 Tax=Vanilla planifolia TaxID=51239 RepID=A0A835UN51_VANPL|nr:hypothetical protein HPP92_019700 [Vanilla planifolia]
MPSSTDYPHLSLLFVMMVLMIVLPSFEAFTGVVGHRRSVLRVLGDGDGSMDYALDLNSSTFDSVLKDSPTSFAIVEFFAHCSFNLDDEKFQNEDTLPWNASDPVQIARAIYDTEEATAQTFDIITDNKWITQETRAPLIMFLQLLAAHHPSKRCRKGTAEILVNFDDLWPLNTSNSSQGTSIMQTGDVTKVFPICGKEVPRGYWIFCRGSRNETRGYSCGLWILLHALSVRVGDGEAQQAFIATCDFIHNFFKCEECRRHFHEMCSSAPSPFRTARSYVLWLWSSHNKVNERLMAVEQEWRTGDSRYPKMLWPPPQICASCSTSTIKPKTGNTKLNWNEDEVYNFLKQHYSISSLSPPSNDETGKSSIKGMSVSDDAASSTHAVTVPVSAALAIALASCAFGALACFWRTQQKNRKQKN